MNGIVQVLWQSALILVAICVILFFLPLAMSLLSMFLRSLFRNTKQ